MSTLIWMATICTFMGAMEKILSILFSSVFFSRSFASQVEASQRKLAKKFGEVNYKKNDFRLELTLIGPYAMWIDCWMTRTVPGWPKCHSQSQSPCPRPSSPTVAPGLAWQSPAFFPSLPTAPLPSVACFQYGVSWQTEKFCWRESLSKYIYLVRQYIGHGRSADFVGSTIDCSTWVQLKVSSFHISSLHGVYGLFKGLLM